MSLSRAVSSIVSIFLGLSAAVAQQAGTATNNAAASASSALTNPPVFQGLMVDAKGKTVGRLFTPVIPFPIPFPAAFVVRQISKIWVLLQVADFTTGLRISPTQSPQFLFQSADCTGPAFMFINQYLVDPVTNATVLTSPALGIVSTIPPATAASIYFAGLPATLTINSSNSAGSPPCFPLPAVPNPNYVGPVETVPVSALGLTLPFSIK